MERELLKQRQREGIEIAKLQGKYKGRKPIPIDWTKFKQLYVEWNNFRACSKMLLDERKRFLQLL